VRSFYLLGRTHEDARAPGEATRNYRRFFEYWKEGDLDREWLQEVERKLAS
jgi:hypothetical protein